MTDFHAMSSLDYDEWERPERPEWPKYINVYEVTRAYGGPEEGGWWYDCGSPVESILCETQEEFDATMKSVKARHCVDDNSRRIGTYSINICVGHEFAAPYPSEKPHYE